MRVELDSTGLALVAKVYVCKLIGLLLCTKLEIMVSIHVKSASFSWFDMYVDSLIGNYCGMAL